MTGQAQPRSAALIGFGRVWHKRVRPAHNEFSYASYFLMLPMRALRERADAALRRNRFGAIAFYDRDHGDGGADALAWFDDLLAREGIHDAQGEVWLQTYPRVLGYVFKPVSFWFAHRRDGTLAAVVAEVNNTFGQRHVYLLAGTGLRWGAEMQADKVFHVSPFCAVAGSYRFRFWLGGALASAASSDTQSARPSRVLARIDHHDASGVLLQTSLGGALQPLTAASARRAFFGHPLMTFAVVARIHWQALRLAWARVPFHRLPSAPEHFVSR